MRGTSTGRDRRSLVRRERAARRRAARGLAGLGLAGLLACGAPISLDSPSPASSSSTAAASTTGSTGGSSTDSGSTLEPPDVTLDVSAPLPPGTCPAACPIELTETWSWTQPVRPGEPLPAERRITAMVPAEGDFVIAEHRDGQAWLTRISSTGVVLWSVPAQMGCNCEITSLAMSPSGQLLVGGQGEFFDDFHVVALGYFSLLLGDFDWVNWEVLYQYLDHAPRVGSIFPLDAAHVGILVIESDFNESPATHQLLELLQFEDGFLYGRTYIDTQPHDGLQWRPRGRLTPSGGVAVGLVDTTTMQQNGYLVWLDPNFYTTAVEPLDSPPDDLVLGAGHRVLVAGHTSPSPGALTVHVSQARPGLPLQWVHTQDLLTADAAPALAVDSTGSAIAAARIAGEDPADASISVWRLDPDGNLVWSTSLPIASDEADRPVWLALDDDDDLVLATTVEGRLHVVGHEQGCQCD